MPAILNYLLHLATAVAMVMAFFVIYTRLTPYDEVTLIRGGNCAAALIQLRLDNDGLGGAIWISAQFHKLSLQRKLFKQSIKTGLFQS